MSRLSREKKRDQNRAVGSAALVTAPIDVRVPAVGVVGAWVGGVPVAAAAGEEIQQAVLNHLQRVARHGQPGPRHGPRRADRLRRTPSGGHGRGQQFRGGTRRDDCSCGRVAGRGEGPAGPASCAVPATSTVPSPVTAAVSAAGAGPAARAVGAGPVARRAGGAPRRAGGFVHRAVGGPRCRGTGAARGAAPA